VSDLRRRNLIVSAALVPFRALRGSAANSAVKVGLIGSGGRGTYDASIVAKDPKARLVAICDIFDDQIEKAKAKIPARDAKVFKDYKELLSSDVDAVIIATPVFLHPEHFEAAVKAGKNIYIEKPAGLDVAGCKRVMRAADGADRKLNITFGFQQRYGPVYLKAKQLLDSGAIGKIRGVHIQFIKGAVTGNEPVLPPPRTEEEKIRQWTVWRATFGDIMVETHCHNIDVMNWFMGTHPTKAYGCGGRTIERRGDIMDHLNVTFDYPDKVQASFIGSQIAPAFYRTNNERFIGANGVIETAREYWTYSLGKGPVTEKSPRDITVDALEEFLRRIAEGKPENTGVRSVESTLTAVMGRMAIDLRREVTWEEMMAS
jgi:myo-inositol 2-dehydrogenase/D-chiro-inositol 1-dehydrogenase